MILLLIRRHVDVSRLDLISNESTGIIKHRRKQIIITTKILGTEDITLEKNVYTNSYN